MSSTLKQQISDLSVKLEPASGDEIAMALNGLLNGGKMYPTSIQAEKPLAEYRIALCGLSKEALRRAYAKLKRGEYPQYNTDFLPIPARFAEIVRGEQHGIVDDLARLKSKAEALKSEPPIDEGARARIGAMLQSFRDARMAEKAGDNRFSPVETLSPERAATLTKMLQLPDARSVGPEQEAHRMKVMKLIENTTSEASA